MQRRWLSTLVSSSALALLLPMLVSISVSAGSRLSVDVAQVRSETKTGKERLSGKAADEQRVNDCKVPPSKRGDKKRSADCPWDKPKQPGS